MSSAMEVKRAILQCCTYILDGSNSLYRDVLIATVSCHTLRPPNHLYVISSYDNRTGVDQCLWLSVVLVILVHDSWVNRLVYILRENSNCTEESTGYWVIHSGISLFIRIRSCTCFCSIAYSYLFRLTESTFAYCRTNYLLIKCFLVFWNRWPITMIASSYIATPTLHPNLPSF